MSRLKAKGEKIYYANPNQKKAGVAISMSEKVDSQQGKLPRIIRNIT